MTRSTAMRRTCRKSCQPSKVSWDWSPHLPAPHTQDSLFASGEAAPLLLPECRVPRALQDRLPSQRGAGPSTCLQATPGPSPLACGPEPAPAPLSPRLPCRAQVGSCRHCPDPARSRGPSSQSALCSSPGLSPCTRERLGSPCGEWTSVSLQWGRGQSFCPLNPSRTG